MFSTRQWACLIASSSTASTRPRVWEQNKVQPRSELASLSGVLSPPGDWEEFKFKLACSEPSDMLKGADLTLGD